MARGATTRHVRFATDGTSVTPVTPVISIRGPRDDEYSVMTYFARHADKCDICADPYLAYRRDMPLCDRGYRYARDVAKYIYAKGGKPFSVIDRQNGDRMQIKVPADCQVINSLVKAFDRGMTVNTPPKPILIVPDSERREKVERVEKAERSPKYVYTTKPHVHEEPRRERERHYREYNVVEIIPSSSRRDRKDRSYRGDRTTEERYRSERKERPVSYHESKGSLYERDEEERRRLQRYQEQPIVIMADPRRRETRR